MLRLFTDIKSNLEESLQEAQSVNQIDSLTDAIDDIASQTTLLSLNASIEAARAGEAGKLDAFSKHAFDSATQISNSVHDVATSSQEGAQATEIVAQKVGSITESVSNIGDVMKEVESANSTLLDCIRIFLEQKRLNDARQ